MDNVARVPILEINGDMAASWKKFKRSFITFLTAYYNDKQEEIKIAVLLNAGGDYLHDIFDSLKFKNEIHKSDLKVVLKKFDEHFLPQTNITYERFKFFNFKQDPNVSYEEYLTKLKNMSQSCSFNNLEEELVRDIFVCGVADKTMQEMLLSRNDLTLEIALNMCRARSVAVQQTAKMNFKWDSQDVIVDAVKKSRISKKNNCIYCGYVHLYGKCPAYGKKCAKCQKFNHFAKVCKTDRLDTIAVDNELSVSALKEESSWYTAALNIQDKEVIFKIDTGAACNIISEVLFTGLGFGYHNLLDNKSVLKSFTNNVVPVIGKCVINCMYNNNCFKITFLVVKGDCCNILGLKTSEQLNLIKRVNSLTSEPLNRIPNKFHSLFNGEVGCMPFKVKIDVDPNVKPVICPLRRIPYSIIENVKNELQKMVKTSIIKKIDEPTEWVNQMVIVVKKDKSLRICLDPRNLNKAIKRTHYPFPTFEEIAAKIGNAKYFCKLDCQAGFWMLPLDNNSTRLCTFQTPWGRYAFLRLPFGLNCAPELFHSIISEIFNKINKVVSFQDDILMWADSINELDVIFNKVLLCAAENGIKFNLKKCVFLVDRVEFLGHVFGSGGVSVSPDKTKTILELKTPGDKKTLQRALGMFNYLSKFIPNFADLTSPLRELLKSDNAFLWTLAHDKAFNLLKKKIVESPVLKFFNPSKELKLSVDASSLGLGAVLLQDEHPIAYASKVLTDVQTRYSQIEKELLAVCFGVEKFRQYILGNNKVSIETDHKPLIGIFQKPLHKVPARLQRMLMRLQPYKFDIKYTPGKHMYLADTLSRDFDSCGCDKVVDLDDDIELQVALLLDNLPIVKNDLDILISHTKNDKTLCLLLKYVETGWPKYYKDVNELCKPYYEFKNEISVINNILFLNNRIIIPCSLRRAMLLKLHTGHCGITRMLDRAKPTVFWLGLNQDVKRFVQCCHTCLKFRDSQAKMYLNYKKVPSLPWLEVGSDVFELNQKYYLVVVDAFSNYIEVLSLPNLNSTTVIEKIKSIFARHGIPLKFYTDGALYYNSSNFKKFANDWCFQHVMSSPHFPQSNGLAESAVKTIKKIFKKALDSNEDLYLALLNHRATPRCEISSPAAILMGRNLRTNIPCNLKHLEPTINYNKDYKLLVANKEKVKAYYDRGAKYRKSLNLGESIIFKKSPKDCWVPGSIIRQTDNPRSYLVEGNEGNRYVRNERHIIPTMSGKCDQRVPKEVVNIEKPAVKDIATPQIVTRSGRVVKSPSYLKDYVTNF